MKVFTKKLLAKHIILLIILSFVIPFPHLLTKTHAQTTPKDRGYFTSSREIEEVKQKYQQGDSTTVAKVNALVSFAGTPTSWPYGAISGQLTAPTSGTCASPQDSSGPDYLKYNDGARLVYAKVLAYFFTGNQAYATFARDRIIELTGTTYFGGPLYNGANQCILELGFSLPLWIQSADLLSTTPVWTTAHTTQFQNWLGNEVYTQVSWASRRRANNWGAAGTNAAAMIADYVSSQAITLKEVNPTVKNLTPQQAYLEHIDQQKARMTGTFQGDTSCSVYGIQTHGGIPDELRRGSAGCLATSLQAADSALVYQITHTDFLIIMSEFLWHRGDTSLYTLTASNGKGSLKNAINFVINNPNNASSIAWESYRTNHLYVANRFYHDSVMRSVASGTPNDAKGTFIAFSHITHSDESKTPPATQPPGSTTQPTATIMPTATSMPAATNMPTATVAPSCPEDITQDGTIDLSDYALLANNFLKSNFSNPRVDINADGIVDLSDYARLALKFLKPCS